MSELVLPALFSDELILQRGRANPIWGWDRPGQTVTLSVEGQASVLWASATAGTDGTFRLQCPELAAGGPYRLRIRGSREVVLENVLVGEVWLASGQSNMEWKVAMSHDAEREIAAADWPEVRMFTASRTALPPGSADSNALCGGGSWRTCRPDVVHDFSAVGYYFAREIHRALGVPVGIIDASWGGTPIEAWTSLDALRNVIDVDRELAEWVRPADEVARVRAAYQATQLRWEEEHLPNDVGNAGEEKGWALADFDDDAWPSMPMPGTWQGRGLPFNGVVWFRKTIDVDPSCAGGDAVLSLGAVDDFDHTYFNGSLVGSHPKGTPGAYQIHRVYRIPGALVKSGKNVIAVRVFDHVGEGGLIGPAPEMFVETSTGERRQSLAGGWRYEVERRVPLVPLDVFRHYPPVPRFMSPQDAPAALFRGMIAPLLPFGLRGILWYQGESNVERHGTYKDNLLAMIRDWRARFDQGPVPFYLVQLANYIASPEWANLREAQTDALSEPSTGMAVTIDIGDPYDIHPRNKQEVGRRLSLLALGRAYGRRDIEDSGPSLNRVELRDGAAVIHFSHADGLGARGGGATVRGFTVAGSDGVYYEAEARIDERHVVVTSQRVPAPKSVRYAWADNPDANLENAADLPAAPFRTDRG